MVKDYLNNAGAGLVSDGTHAAMLEHLLLERKMGAMAAANLTKESQSAFYSRAAEVVGAVSPTEIAFTDSASRGWNVLLDGFDFKSGDSAVTLSSEFGTNLVSLFRRAQAVGASVRVIPCAQDGSFNLDDFIAAARGATLVAISHTAAHASIENPVEEIGMALAGSDTTYIVDGCQALGQMPVDVTNIGCHAYTTTGRKWLRGPRGTGFVYVKEGSPFHALSVDLASADLEIAPESREVTDVLVRADARQFEMWERSVASMLGLSNALKELLALDTTAYDSISTKGNLLRNAVAQNPQFELMGRETARVGNIGFFCTNPQLEESLTKHLDAAGISFSVMHDWDCPLHFPANGTSRIFRLSPHYYTDQRTVELAAETLARFRG